METFKDDKGFLYWGRSDALYVDVDDNGVRTTKKIGIFTTNLNTGLLTMTVQRTSEEKVSWGWMVPAEPFRVLPIGRLCIVEKMNEGERYWVCDVASTKDSAWTYNPHIGCECQLIFPYNFFYEIKESMSV